MRNLKRISLSNRVEPIIGFIVVLLIYALPSLALGPLIQIFALPKLAVLISGSVAAESSMDFSNVFEYKYFPLYLFIYFILVMIPIINKFRNNLLENRIYFDDERLVFIDQAERGGQWEPNGGIYSRGAQFVFVFIYLIYAVICSYTHNPVFYIPALLLLVGLLVHYRIVKAGLVRELLKRELMISDIDYLIFEGHLPGPDTDHESRIKFHLKNSKERVCEIKFNQYSKLLAANENIPLLQKEYYVIQNNEIIEKITMNEDGTLNHANK